MEASPALSRIGLACLAVMGQNLALNIAEKGFPISVYNPRDFVLSIERPRSVIILVKAGAPVDQTIAALSAHVEPDDTIIDGGNEWYENTERRIAEANGRGRKTRRKEDVENTERMHRCRTSAIRHTTLKLSGWQSLPGVSLGPGLSLKLAYVGAPSPGPRALSPRLYPEQPATLDLLLG